MSQVSITPLSFGSSLATKCMSLNDKWFMNKSVLIDLNPVNLIFKHSRLV